MARKKDTTGTAVDYLMLVPLCEKLAKVLAEGMAVARRYPEILARIDADQNAAAKDAKALRIADRCWVGANQPTLAGFELPEAVGLDPKELKLGTGRPRMRAEVVYLFLILRGYYGAVCSDDIWSRMIDSLTVRYHLAQYSAGMPGQTTVLENLNMLSRETLDFILKCQLDYISHQGLDEFQDLTIDSTHTQASSAWPADSSLILKFLSRAYDLSQQLEEFGAPNFRQWYCRRWFRQLKRFAFEIDVISKKSGKPFRKAYRSFLTVADKLIAYLGKEYDRLAPRVLTTNLRPSRRLMLERVWDTIENSLVHALSLSHVAQDRVLNGNKVEREDFEKIYSISDPNAAFITKGGRETIFGYRPQLGRSANGFVSAVILPQGNTPDNTMLHPMVLDHIERTSSTPETVSCDDGYANEVQREEVLGLGVKAVSISGSKGRRMTSNEDWNSDLYRDLRRTRSAVESLMFTGKFRFDFGTFHRRGIEKVRCEMLEKVIAHNLWRIVHEKEKQEHEPRARAA
jgi:hypothetical protein